MTELPRSVSFSFRDVGFLTAYALVAVVILGNHYAGASTALAPLVAFGLIPLVDAWLGVDVQNPAPAQVGARERAGGFRAILYLWVPVQVGLLAYSAWRFSALDLGAAARAGFLVSTGIATGGIGITIAHELGHRSHGLDRWGARVLLTSVCYGHFTVEHNRGHHIRVATPHDPATARLGESVWWFFLRNLPQQYLSAWRLEIARLSSRGLPALHPHNRMLWYSLSVPAFGAAFFLAFGPLGAVFFYAQSLVAIFLLECVNYIEHYGLLRKELEPGRYERVSTWHSWNASFRISNWLLFRLQRHADHHAHAGRRYQVLRHLDDAPQLPASYPAMILLALVPPLWRRVMDPRVRAVRERCGTSRDAPAG